MRVAEKDPVCHSDYLYSTYADMSQKKPQKIEVWVCMFNILHTALHSHYICHTVHVWSRPKAEKNRKNQT